jgi:hypothetical protein
LKTTLKDALETALQAAGIESAEQRNRGFQHLLATTLDPVATHVVKYLEQVAVQDVTVEDVGRWWRIRGQIAHGSDASVDLSDLNRLLTCFQAALRRESGLRLLQQRFAVSAARRHYLLDRPAGRRAFGASHVVSDPCLDG